jgi:phage tail P2-like protein
MATLAADRARLVPPSIGDLRGKAFGEVLAAALDEPEFAKFLLERIDDVDASALPFLIREFSIEEFVEPGMREAVIRRLLKGSHELHARKGFFDGVRRGLEMLGVSVLSWRPWLDEVPKAAPGTHVVVVRIDEAVFAAEGQAITTRLQRVVQRMVSGMKRHSQYVGLRYSVPSTVPAYVGAVVRSRLTIRPRTEPITQLSGRPQIFIGAAVRTRLRVSPQVPA